MHVQRTENSCGPDCVGTIASNFGISQPYVDSAFGVSDIRDFSDIHDSPAHHESAFKRLNLAYRTRTCAEILSGACAPGRVEVLLHSKDDPHTLWPESWGIQHWAIVESVGNGLMWLDMGYADMRPRSLSFVDFQARYAKGGPTATAYEITGIGTAQKPRWYSRLWVWLTEKIR